MTLSWTTVSFEIGDGVAQEELQLIELMVEVADAEEMGDRWQTTADRM